MSLKNIALFGIIAVLILAYVAWTRNTQKPASPTQTEAPAVGEAQGMPPAGDATGGDQGGMPPGGAPPQAQPPIVESAANPGLAWSVPSGWTDQGGRSMRLATYVFHGWRNSVATRATIEALGYWGTSEDHQDVERRMCVGSEDFIYKLVHGWRGFKHGAPEGPTTEKTRVVGVAYTFFKEIWQAILSNADRRRPAGRAPVSPSRL